MSYQPEVTQGSSNVTVQEVPAPCFKVQGQAVFSLVRGGIVGSVKSNGKPLGYNIPFLVVYRKWLEQANQQDVETVKRLAEAKLAVL